MNWDEMMKVEFADTIVGGLCRYFDDGIHHGGHIVYDYENEAIFLTDDPQEDLILTTVADMVPGLRASDDLETIGHEIADRMWAGAKQKIVDNE